MKTVYKSGIGWILWAAYGVLLLTGILITVDAGIWVGALYCIIVLGMFLVLCHGCWYEIDGDDLKVYTFFRPTSLPINKISEVRYCTGYLASAALSLKRLSIKFSDRSVLKSSMPIEISPKDRDAFVKQLLSINPSINVINDKAN